jgi:hypothetical protein
LSLAGPSFVPCPCLVTKRTGASFVASPCLVTSHWSVGISASRVPARTFSSTHYRPHFLSTRREDIPIHWSSVSPIQSLVDPVHIDSSIFVALQSRVWIRNRKPDQTSRYSDYSAKDSNFRIRSHVETRATRFSRESCSVFRDWSSSGLDPDSFD